MLRFSLTSAVRLSLAGLVLKTPTCSQLKDQKVVVIDEFTSDMDTLSIDDMYFL